MSGQFVAIKVTVLPNTDQDAATALERLSHMLTGLALDGTASKLKVIPYELEDAEAVDPS